MSYETELDDALTILLGKAQGTIALDNTPLPDTTGTTTGTVSTTRVVDLAFVLGISGTALTTGTHQFVRLGLNGTATVVSWSLAATVSGTAHSGSVSVDVQIGSSLSGVASIGTPSMSSVSEKSDQSPTGWSATTIDDPSWVMAVVTSADGTLEVVGLTLRLSVAL